MKPFNKFSLLFARKSELTVLWRSDRVSLALTQGQGRASGHTILNEPLGAELTSKVKTLVGKTKARTLLIIPRSEVLQKEMVVPASRRGDLEGALTQILPYAPTEMAYSLGIDTRGDNASSKALLYAIPEQRIKAIMERLRKLGVVVDEVVSEDQALFWLFKDSAQSQSILVFDHNSERSLFLVLQDSTLLISKTYPGTEELSSVFSEMAFSLLQSGVKPQKAYIFGTDAYPDAARALGMPVENIDEESESSSRIPLAFKGALNWSKCRPLSLLPSDEKLKQRTRNELKAFKKSALALGFFVLSLSLLATSHLYFMDQKVARWQSDATALKPDVTSTKQIRLSLNAIEEAQGSKRELLGLLKYLANNIPASVRLKELRIDGERLVFEGESHSHSFVTETVQVFEKSRGLEEVKLEHTRLRRRLNKEFFDFEVSARWSH